MKKQNAFETFAFLDRIAHRVNEVATTTLFPEMYRHHNNDTQYWLYSDLRTRFPEIHDDPTLSMYEILHVRMTLAYNQNGYGARAPNCNFSTYFYRHVEIIPSARGKNIDDAKLTRFACAAITRTPATPYAHAYFISPGADAKEMQNTGNDLLRITRRNRIATIERTISGILHANKMDYGRFAMMANAALFCDPSANNIKARNNIPVKQNDPLTNYMRHTSLGARLYAMDKAIGEFNHQKQKSPNVFENLVRRNLENARTLMIQNYGRAPENDLSQTSVSALQSKYNQIWRDFCNRYGDEKLR